MTVGRAAKDGYFACACILTSETGDPDPVHPSRSLGICWCTHRLLISCLAIASQMRGLLVFSRINPGRFIGKAGLGLTSDIVKIRTSRYRSD